MWQQLVRQGNWWFSGSPQKDLACNMKYLANLTKKYWTCFCYYILTNNPVCCPPSVRVQARQQPSRKICPRIQLSFGFWGCAVKAYDNFSGKLAWLSRTIFWLFRLMDLYPRVSKVEIETKLWHKEKAGVNLGGISRLYISTIWDHRWITLLVKHAKLKIICHHAKKLIHYFTN